jgi:putative component of membrane protein insertase Oxa1/YidC/SpoIIIJ protein YidD
MRRIGIALLSAPIHAYRALLSPLLPQSCRFTPSCSAYALEALELHGPLQACGLLQKGWRAAIPFPGSAVRRALILFPIRNTRRS